MQNGARVGFGKSGMLMTAKKKSRIQLRNDTYICHQNIASKLSTYDDVAPSIQCNNSQLSWQRILSSVSFQIHRIYISDEQNLCWFKQCTQWRKSLLSSNYIFNWSWTSLAIPEPPGHIRPIMKLYHSLDVQLSFKMPGTFNKYANEQPIFT